MPKVPNEQTVYCQQTNLSLSKGRPDITVMVDWALENPIINRYQKVQQQRRRDSSMNELKAIRFIEEDSTDEKVNHVEFINVCFNEHQWLDNESYFSDDIVHEII